nr:immunoglobulin light chain junction region [Macaca mulatta]MOV66165.1 immunoglobulin light chain junction region [Macaca mulatta]MOV66343.1 immunoglobulin light chain junction region [Macaca mulatta]MOV66939.1 immunoglobulin light chain junction region [Macaca mulatta]MOV67082.1 immunoglobulin light chain junction region [Macaca mulatta]
DYYCQMYDSSDVLF